MPIRKLNGKCPFNDQDFFIPVEEPCPVCGMTGEIDDDEPSKCVDDQEPAPITAGARPLMTGGDNEFGW